MAKLLVLGMETKTRKKLYSSFLISILFFYSSYLLICALGDDSDLLISCLASHGVQNYTRPSSDPNSDFDRLFHVNILNPLFKKKTSERLKPSLIVLPNSKEELSSTIRCCTRSSWTIKLRSGGHSYEGLSYISETPFVLVDLMNLDRISIDLDSETAWVESGATLGQLYYAIHESTDSYGFTAGWCPNVGVGGHLSGGGLGMLSKKYGLAADNVVDAILIDSNGAILDRRSMGEDVFWAIRGGGGGCWGAVYSWKIKLLPVPRKVTVFREMRTVTMEEASLLIHKWQHVAEELDRDFSMSIFTGANEKTVWIAFLGLYLGLKSAAKPIIDSRFPELGLLEQDFSEMNWGESFAHLAGIKFADFNNRSLVFDGRAFRAKVDATREPLPLKAIHGALEILSKEPYMFIAVNCLGGGRVAEISSSFTPFPHRNGTKLLIEYLYFADIDEPKHDVFTKGLKKIYDYMEPFASKEPRVAYINHIDLDLGTIDWRDENCSSNAIEISRNWGEKYFLSNYERLVKAKTLIDPNNVFNHPQSIPPMRKKFNTQDPSLGFCVEENNMQMQL